MLTVQEAVKRYSKDPTKIQPLIPDFSHVRRNIVIGPPQYLTWDQVYIDDAQGNTARMVDATPGEKGGADAQHIADLEESFKEGWRQHEPLPAVQEHDLNLHKEGVFAPQKRYRLKYGFGRILAERSVPFPGRRPSPRYGQPCLRDEKVPGIPGVPQ